MKIFFYISIILLFVQSCTKSQIISGSTDTQTSIYANPETIRFSPEHYATHYKNTYLRLAYEFPNMDQYNAIKSAASSEEARDLYETYIKEMDDSGGLKDGILAFYIQMLGVGT